MNKQEKNANGNHGKSSGFKRINIKNLDLLIRERVFEITSPRVKYLLRNLVRGDFEVIECHTLKICEYTFEEYKGFSTFPDLNYKYIYVDNDKFIKEIRQDNGNIQKVYVSNNEIWNVKNHLEIVQAQPGTVSKLSEHLILNHHALSVYSSTMTRGELKMLFTRNKITYLTVRNLRIIDDYSNELPKEEAFILFLKAFKNTPDKPCFEFDFVEVTPNWLQMLSESGCKFCKIYVNMVFKNEQIRIDSELLHKFILFQEKGFEITFNVSNRDPDENFDQKFYNYFKKNDERFRSREKYYLICKSLRTLTKDVVFGPK